MKYGFAIVLLLFSLTAGADELRPAYLQVAEIEAGLYDVVWKVPARGASRLSLHARFDEQTVNVTTPVDGFAGGAHIQQWRIARPDGLAGARVSIDGLPHTSTEVLLRVEYMDGASMTHRLTPDAPTYTVPAKPSPVQTAWTYLVLGVEHILIGVDHLLFVLVLLLLIKSTRKLIATITAFTVAHSITLSLAALELIRVPVPPVEACIALSIVFVATEIIRGHQGRPGITQQRPWIVAFTFGLLHGLGFAAALGEIGLPQNAIPTALVFFNVGVEIGQLLFVGAVLSVIGVLKRLPLPAPGHWQRIPPYAIGGLASFWVIERTLGFWVV